MKNVAQNQSLTKRQSYDRDMEINGFEKYKAIACEYKNMYDFKLGNLMDYYGIETEAEIISGNILENVKILK